MSSHQEKYKKKVFISFQNENRDFVEKLEQKLRRNKIDAWVYYEENLPGELWGKKIPLSMMAADAIIILISKFASQRKGVFHDEVKLAIKCAADPSFDPPKIIIPLLIDSEAKKMDVLRRFHVAKVDDFYHGLWFEKLLQRLGIVKFPELEYSIERQEVIETIERLKKELIVTWIQRDKNENGTRKWNRYETFALNIVKQIDMNSEKIGKRFQPEALYKEILFDPKKSAKSDRLKNEMIIYYPPNGILVHKRYVDKRLFIIEKGDEPRNAKSSKRIGEYEYKDVMYGFAAFYAGPNNQPYIQPGREYFVFDGFTNDQALFVGKFTT